MVQRGGKGPGVDVVGGVDPEVRAQIIRLGQGVDVRGVPFLLGFGGSLGCLRGVRGHLRGAVRRIRSALGAGRGPGQQQRRQKSRRHTSG